MPEAQTIPVEVNYSNGQWSYDPPGNIVLNLRNTQEQGNYAIVFTLTGDPGITWASTWINWVHNGPPPSLEEGYTLPELGYGNQVALGVYNDVNSPVTYNFTLTIDTPSGQVTSPDPEIVLDPPGT